MKIKLIQHKYKIAIFGLLVFSSTISMSIYIARILYADQTDYTFLPKNLFLAWIPFGIALVTYGLAEARFMRLLIPISAFLWLIFFPNAPYLLTDFKHLQDQVAYAPAWADVLLFAWFSWTGFMLGIVSLYLMQQVVKKTFGWYAGWLFVFVASVLGAAGIYIGRFLRLNSWDVLQSPIPILKEIWRVLSNPFDSPSSIVFSALFAMLFLFVYLLMYAFGHSVIKES
jgi:uncharacterized membrane protein